MAINIIKLFGLGVALVTLALATGNSGQVGSAQTGCTVTVQPGQSIQQAIDRASAGAVVCLSAGTFQENIEIKKSVILKGTGRERTILKSSDKDAKPIIHIASNADIQVALESFNIGEAFPLQDGILISGKTKVTLGNIQVSTKWRNGISVQDSTQVVLANSEVSGNGNGLEVRGTATVEIKDSIFRDNSGCGIFASSKEVKVRGTPNEMRGNGADLCGFAPASVRKSLVPQTNKTELTVPGDYGSVQEAIDAVAPGGTILLQAGIYEVGLTLWKPLVLRGAGTQQTTLKALRHVTGSITNEGQVRLESLTVTGNTNLLFVDKEGLLIYGPADLRNVQVSSTGSRGIGLDIRGSVQVNLSNCMISDNEGGGLFVMGSAQVSLNTCTVSRNGRSASDGVEDEGIIIFGHTIFSPEFRPPQVILINSMVSDNKGGGIALFGTAQLSLLNSTVSGNEGFGLVIGFLGGLPQATLTKSTIANNNGMGIFVEGTTQLGLSDSIIKDNADWGLAAYLKQCGFESDLFTGQVIFDGKNIIEGNSKSGKQDKGNPGNHPFKNLPDGQVCLP